MEFQIDQLEQALEHSQIITDTVDASEIDNKIEKIRKCLKIINPTPTDVAGERVDNTFDWLCMRLYLSLLLAEDSLLGRGSDLSKSAKNFLTINPHNELPIVLKDHQVLTKYFHNSENSSSINILYLLVQCYCRGYLDNYADQFLGWIKEIVRNFSNSKEFEDHFLSVDHEYHNVVHYIIEAVDDDYIDDSKAQKLLKSLIKYLPENIIFKLFSPRNYKVESYTPLFDLWCSNNFSNEIILNVTIDLFAKVKPTYLLLRASISHSRSKRLMLDFEYFEHFLDHEFPDEQDREEAQNLKNMLQNLIIAYGGFCDQDHLNFELRLNMDLHNLISMSLPMVSFFTSLERSDDQIRMIQIKGLILLGMNQITRNIALKLIAHITISWPQKQLLLDIAQLFFDIAPWVQNENSLALYSMLNDPMNIYHILRDYASLSLRGNAIKMISIPIPDRLTEEITVYFYSTSMARSAYKKITISEESYVPGKTLLLKADDTYDETRVYFSYKIGDVEINEEAKIQTIQAQLQSLALLRDEDEENMNFHARKILEHMGICPEGFIGLDFENKKNYLYYIHGQLGIRKKLEHCDVARVYTSFLGASDVLSLRPVSKEMLEGADTIKQAEKARSKTNELVESHYKFVTAKTLLRLYNEPKPPPLKDVSNKIGKTKVALALLKKPSNTEGGPPSKKTRFE